MVNFDKYFLSNFQFFLEDFHYKLLQPAAPGTVIQMRCKDHLEAEMATEKRIKIRFTRAISFDPECVYDLIVTYGALVEINEEGLNEIDWSNLDLAKEIRAGQCSVLNSLVSRAVLQIAQVTNASGQPPMITPPAIAKKKAAFED